MKLNLNISGMSCEHCTSYVSRVLSEVPGVEVEYVDLEGAGIIVDDTVTEGQLKIIIEDAGYELIGVNVSE